MVLNSHREIYEPGYQPKARQVDLILTVATKLRHDEFVDK